MKSSRYVTGQGRGCPVAQPGNVKSSRCATGQERGCPVAQPGNMWLSRYATGQHKAAPLSNRTRSKPSRCATGVQLGLFCCLTSTSKLSCTVSQCHLQETRHLGILRLLHCQYQSTSHFVLEIETAVEAPYPVAQPAIPLRNGAARYVTGRRLGIRTEHIHTILMTLYTPSYSVNKPPISVGCKHQKPGAICDEMNTPILV